MPNALSKPEDVVFESLDTPGDLGTALDRMMDVGYRGAVAGSVLNMAKLYQLEVNGPGNARPTQGRIGDVFVWHPIPAYVESMPHATFLERYNITGETTATSKPTQVVYLPLNNATDFGNAQSSAVTVDYFGSTITERVNSVVTWRIELNGPGNPETVKASGGDVLVWHPTSKYLESMTGARFLERYTPQ